MVSKFMLQLFRPTMILLLSLASSIACRKAGLLDNKKPIEVYSVRPLVAHSGELISVSGAHFDEDVTLSFAGKPLSDVQVLSSQMIEGRMPKLIRRGKDQLSLTRNGIELSKTVYYAGDAGDYPLVTLDPSAICSDQAFYNAEGQLKEGTRTCLTETKSDCSQEGDTDCIVSGSLVAVETQGLAPKVLTGYSVAGVAGTASAGSYVACTAANQSGCIATSSYRTMDLSNASAMTDLTSNNFQSSLASNTNFEFWDSTGTRHQASGSNQLVPGSIKAGITLFAVNGAFPSASYPLPSASVTADLESATFAAKIKSNSPFEYWTSDGSYQSGSGDADIDGANIKDGISIFGSTGTLTAEGLTCPYSSQASCEANSACQWVSNSCRINPWNIRIGSVVAGVSGSLKLNCRDRANSSIFNSDAMPPGTSGTTSGTTIHWWDTLDDYNNNGAFPSSTVSSWSSDTDCDRNVWRDMTTDGSCDSANEDCLVQDKISGLIWSESYPVSGSAAATTAKDWSQAVLHCDSLVYGGASDWRLPAKKELMAAFVHGLRSLGYNGTGTQRAAGSLDNNGYFIGDVDSLFWSATTVSDATSDARVVYNGGTAAIAKSSTNQVICVRP